MPDANTAAAICFYCSLLQGIGAAIYIGTMFFPWLKRKRGGSMKPFAFTHQKVLIVLICGALLTAGIGLVLVFRVPSTHSATIPTNQNPAQANSNSRPNVPASQVSSKQEKRQQDIPPKQHTSKNPSKPKPNPCPDGYTILHNVTAGKSSWDTAKTTGFDINGPCFKLDGAVSKDNDTDFKLSNGQPSPPVTLNCNGSGNNCANTNNGTQVVNQFGPPKMIMTDSQRNAIRDAMSPFLGISVSIICHDPTEDSMAFANQLAQGLRDAGISVEGPGAVQLFSRGALPSGLSLTIGKNRMNAANALALTLIRLGLVPKPPIPAFRADEKNDDELRVLIVPYR